MQKSKVKAKNNKYEPVIGLEIHIELKTNSKMFCGCPADWFGKEPNSLTCPVCLGLPGALPVPNKKAVEWCVLLGLALNCEIPLHSKFDRKHYFYPDLPKGYQISQYDKPFAVKGYLNVKTATQNLKSDGKKTIGIRRVHMEEDTGKLTHATIDGKKVTLIDFNRSGVPLVEIVTEPDLNSSEEAKIVVKKLYRIIRYLGISDAEMEKGSMRLEPNISINVKTITPPSRGTPPKAVATQKSNLPDKELPAYKVEVKNINSFNFVKKAIDYEIERQIKILEKGETPKQETRGWDEKKGVTVPQRSKEEAHDYRYFPEPDIPPIRWTKSQISNLKSQIGELPDAKSERFMLDYRLSETDASILTSEPKIADYFEKTVKISALPAKQIANWLINKRMDLAKISPAELVSLIEDSLRFNRIDESKFQETIRQVLIDNPKAVSDYKSGRPPALMFLVGQVVKKLGPKIDTQKARKALSEKISENAPFF